MTARTLKIAESGGCIALAVLLLFWREPNMPIALHLLPPLGAALWATEPLLSYKLSARKRTTLNIIGGVAMLSGVFYDAFVAPGPARAFHSHSEAS
jgi:hypothetical protein